MKTMTSNGKLRREMKIRLNVKGDNTYEVTDREGNVLLNADDDYFIYFKNVNFKQGYIEGRYLGETHDKSSLFGSDCKHVIYKDGQFFMYGDPYYHDGEILVNARVVKTARLVAVNNKKRTVIIIQST